LTRALLQPRARSGADGGPAIPTPVSAWYGGSMDAIKLKPLASASPPRRDI
jgi:hypothetical protein